MFGELDRARPAATAHPGRGDGARAPVRVWRDVLAAWSAQCGRLEEEWRKRYHQIKAIGASEFSADAAGKIECPTTACCRASAAVNEETPEPRWPQ